MNAYLFLRVFYSLAYFKKACIAKDTANSIDITIVARYSNSSPPRLRYVPTDDSAEKAPLLSVLDLWIRTRITRITDKITFTARMRDCIFIILTHEH